MARMMGTFICDRIFSLLSIVEKFKRARRYPILGHLGVKQQIQGFLSSFENDFPGCSVDEDTVKHFIMMMEEMKFCVRLSSDRFLFPSLLPFGTFRWNFMHSLTLTMGRRIKLAHGSVIFGFWFCDLQVMTG